MLLQRSILKLGFVFFLLCVGECLQGAPEIVVGVATQVIVAGRAMTLQTGQPVVVESVANGFATVRFTLPDGAVRSTVVPVRNLQQKAVPAPPTEPSGGQSGAVANVQASAQTLLKPGWNNVQLEALPTPSRKPNWFHYGFDPKAEKFTIYVPHSYGPGKPCGVLGWTNPGDGAGIPKQFEPLFEEYRLIAVAGERCGNKQESDRRAGLLVSAILEISKTMQISRDRVILSGLSGGGRLSALGVFCHPEIFSGAISWCGGHFYKDYPDSSKPNAFAGGFPTAEKINDPGLPVCVAEAKKKARFVLLTGPKDFNLGNSHDIESAMSKEHFQVRLIEEPGLGHAVGSVDTMRQALEFVLGKPPAP